MEFRTLVLAASFTLLAASSGLAQAGQRGRPPARPTPRQADGRVSFGPLPGETGVWLPGAGGAERLVEFEAADPIEVQFPIAAAARYPGKLNIRDVPFQPWSKEVYNYRRENQLEPHTRCKPSGGPRQFLTPYGVEFVSSGEAQRVYIFDIGDRIASGQSSWMASLIRRIWCRRITGIRQVDGKATR